MKPTLSAIEDKSSIVYRGRADLSEIEDGPAMSEATWKDRLSAAIDATGRSHRELSLAAELGAGYIHSILKEGKDPTIGRLKKVCDAVGVSVFYVLGGFDITPDKERFLRLLDQVEDDTRRSVLHLLRIGRKPEETQEPGA